MKIGKIIPEILKKPLDIDDNYGTIETLTNQSQENDDER